MVESHPREEGEEQPRTVVTENRGGDDDGAKDGSIDSEPAAEEERLTSQYEM